MQPTIATDPLSPHLLETAYREHCGWLHGWLRRKLGNAADAADLAQDTFVRLLNNPASVLFKDGPPGRGQLALVANGLVINLWRRRAIERDYLDSLALVPQALAPSPEARALIIETLCEIDAMLESLPGKCRQAFLLSHLEGLTCKDVAARLGIGESTVRKYIAQAMMQCMLVAASGDIADLG